MKHINRNMLLNKIGVYKFVHCNEEFRFFFFVIFGSYQNPLNYLRSSDIKNKVSNKINLMIATVKVQRTHTRITSFTA